MRINDIIYFSPNLKLEDLNISNKNLVLNSFKERIETYYFQPIDILISRNQAFASGALECLLIDAFARYSTIEDGVRNRIIKWCEDYLNVDNELANQFYEFFRCGLLHESHIKSHGQFCFDEHPANKALQKISDYIIVNPLHLFTELKKFLDWFINKMYIDEDLYKIFIDRIEIDYGEEIKKNTIKNAENHS